MHDTELTQALPPVLSAPANSVSVQVVPLNTETKAWELPSESSYCPPATQEVAEVHDTVLIWAPPPVLSAPATWASVHVGVGLAPAPGAATVTMATTATAAVTTLPKDRMRRCLAFPTSALVRTRGNERRLRVALWPRGAASVLGVALDIRYLSLDRSCENDSSILYYGTQADVSGSAELGSRPAEWCHLDRSILNAMTIMP